MWDIRPITEDDAWMFRARMARGFGLDPGKDEDEAAERFRATFDYDRTLAAFDGAEMIGTAAAFPLGVTVPGGAEVAMGGTTVVTVQPTHRRRGVLRALMEAHLDDVAGHEEPLAGLWASESSIYGRFGYGPSTYRHKVEIDGSSVTMRLPVEPGSVRLVEGEEVARVIVDLYERFRIGRPGALTRSDAWWAYRILADPESWRGGASSLRIAVAEESGVPVGYARYRQKDHWDDFIASGEVQVDEVVASTATGHRSLWSFLMNIDLFPRVTYFNLPVDDPLPEAVSDRRRIRRMLVDGLWIRLMDVIGALESRAYETDGDLTFEVIDHARPATSGTFRLEVTGGIGECRRVDQPAEMSIESDVLGQLYLGGASAVAMASAGRIEGDGDTVARMHRIFRTAAAPWCPEVF